MVDGEVGELEIDSARNPPVCDVKGRGGQVADLNVFRLPVLRVVMDFTEDDLLREQGSGEEKEDCESCSESGGLFHE